MPLKTEGDRFSAVYDIFVCQDCQSTTWRYFPGGQLEIEYLIDRHNQAHEMQRLYSRTLPKRETLFQAPK